MVDPEVQTPLVVVEDLRKSFPGVERPILDGLSITIPRGQFNLVVGRSGTGKSTLLHCISGLEQFERGSIKLDELELAGRSVEALAAIRLQSIGLVFQFFNLIGSLSLEQNILLPTYLSNLDAQVAADRMKQLTGLMEIDHLLHKFPHEVSGGEAQRVAIARALILQPKLVLADEPTGNLDEESARRVFELFRDIVKKFGVTVLMVSHDASFVSQCDNVFELSATGTIT